MLTREPRFEHDEARELWRRAAELQLAAEQESQKRAALTPPNPDGLSLEQVAEAASGAGIDPDYVVMAVAERHLPDSELIRRDRWTARWLRRLVRGVDEVQVSVTFEETPQSVLAAFRSVAATSAFEMEHEETLGDDPARDGVLVYRLAGTWGQSSKFHSEMELADARVLIVTIRPEGNGARLRIRVPMFRRGLNLALATGFTGGLGAGGSFGGAAAGGAIAGLVGTASIALVAAPAVVGAALGGAVGLAGYRKLYHWARGMGDTALKRLVKAIRLEVQTRQLEVESRNERDDSPS